MTVTKSIECHVCGGKADLKYSFPFLPVYACHNCKTLVGGEQRAKPRTRDWGSEESEIDGYYHQQFLVKDYRSVELLKRFRITPGRALDIGCAYGYFLHLLSKAGWKVEGVEPSPSLVQRAKQNYGLELRNTIFNPQEFPAQSFQLVTLFDVIEHLRQPGAVLQGIRQVMVPGGHLLMKVPNWNSLTSRACAWSYFASFGRITGPAEMLTQAQHSYPHVAYFTKKTLRRLIEVNGFKVVALETETTIIPDGFFDRLEFKAIPKPARWISEGLMRLLQFAERLFRSADTITILARKTTDKT